MELKFDQVEAEVELAELTELVELKIDHWGYLV